MRGDHQGLRGPRLGDLGADAGRAEIGRFLRAPPHARRCRRGFPLGPRTDVRSTGGASSGGIPATPTKPRAGGAGTRTREKNHAGQLRRGCCRYEQAWGGHGGCGGRARQRRAGWAGDAGRGVTLRSAGRKGEPVGAGHMRARGSPGGAWVWGRGGPVQAQTGTAPAPRCARPAAAPSGPPLPSAPGFGFAAGSWCNPALALCGPRCRATGSRWAQGVGSARPRGVQRPCPRRGG